MGLMQFLRRTKNAPTDEERREFLRKTGRITEGVIIDSATLPNGGEIVYFTYTLNGVDFESSEILTAEQSADPLKYAAGQRVNIRYDQRNQGNSTLE
jgi:hypothetical protein